MKELLNEANVMIAEQWDDNQIMDVADDLDISTPEAEKFMNKVAYVMGFAVNVGQHKVKQVLNRAGSQQISTLYASEKEIDAAIENIKGRKAMQGMDRLITQLGAMVKESEDRKIVTETKAPSMEAYGFAGWIIADLVGIFKDKGREEEARIVQQFWRSIQAP